MKLFKKTYHFFSALTLILFLSSIVLPMSISAATLFCDMDMEAMAQAHNEGHDTCCDRQNLPIAEDSYGSSNSSCTHQEVCAEALSSEDNSKRATLLVTKELVATVVFTNIFLGDNQNPGLQEPKNEAIKSQKSPPLFLLNSTFLN